MKKILLALLLAVPMLTVAQDAAPADNPSKFTWTKDDGLTKFVVVPIEGKTALELHSKALSWLSQRTDIRIKHSEVGESLKLTVESDKIRCATTMGYTNCDPSEIEIEMSFKDGRYRMDVLSMRYDSGPKFGGWQRVDLRPPFASSYYNKKGEIRGIFKWLETLPTFMNELNDNYKASAKNVPAAKKSEW